MSVDLMPPDRADARRIPSMGTPTARPHRHPIAELVHSRLLKSMYVELRSIRCDFADGVLTLSGLVPTFYLKQVVTSLAEDMEGVERVENQVDVIDIRA